MILNRINSFISIMIAISIQPRLNTEEYLIISIIFVLLSCKVLPNPIDNKINRISKNFVWYIIKKIGATFCQVIKIVS